MKNEPPVKNQRDLQERLAALKTKRELHETELLASAKTTLRPASLLKNILHDIASERKIGLDLLRIGSGLLSGIVTAKSGVVGRGAVIADLLVKAVSSFRKKKTS